MTTNIYEPSQVTLNKYGLTQEDFTDILLYQNYSCAICKQSFQNIKPTIDHSHSTNIIRGLLCYKCNNGLGMFLDDLCILHSATKYLKNQNQLQDLLKYNHEEENFFYGKSCIKCGNKKRYKISKGCIKCSKNRTKNINPKLKQLYKLSGKLTKNPRICSTINENEVLHSSEVNY